MYHNHIPKMRADLSQFWVVTVVSNPERFKRRFELYWQFEKLCRDAEVKLITVEQAFGNREFCLTQKDNPYHLQVRSESQIWLKENLINLGIKHALHRAERDGGNVREVAWIDADCMPASTPRHWFEETWHQLQHFDFVQMWEEMLDLDINHRALGVPNPSFMANYIKHGSPNPKIPNFELFLNRENYAGPGVTFGRPGLAWAARIDAINKVGRLIDFCILGAGDWYMAHALIGTLKHAKSEYACGPYQQKLLLWQDKAVRHIKKNVGFVPGLVLHYFHGKKRDRKYGSRGKILAECKFNPDVDLKYDGHGLISLDVHEERQIVLRDKIRQYFRGRNEDSIDL